MTQELRPASDPKVSDVLFLSTLYRNLSYTKRPNGDGTGADSIGMLKRACDDNLSWTKARLKEVRDANPSALNAADSLLREVANTETF
jgi:hypothetical protein